MPDLVRELDLRLAQVPCGRVTTYGELARAMGDVRAARWIGEHLVDHAHTESCGCHRVVRSTGELGLYVTGRTADKAMKLQAEGVAVAGDRVDLSNCVTAAEFTGAAPLTSLQRTLDEVGARVREERLTEPPRMYCGLDVAYRQDASAVAAAVLVDAASLETVREWTRTAPAAFPYIPGYLTFRELPLLLALWDDVRPDAEPGTVCLIDGNGRMHPRRAGIASGFGVLADVPTIGVSKSLLCGRVERTDAHAAAAAVLDRGDLLGVAIRPHGSTRPVYVSVGNRITLNEAEVHVRRALVNHRLPEPAYRADRLSKIAKRQPE